MRESGWLSPPRGSRLKRCRLKERVRATKRGSGGLVHRARIGGAARAMAHKTDIQTDTDKEFRSIIYGLEF